MYWYTILRLSWITLQRSCSGLFLHSNSSSWCLYTDGGKKIGQSDGPQVAAPHWCRHRAPHNDHRQWGPSGWIDHWIVETGPKYFHPSGTTFPFGPGVDLVAGNAKNAVVIDHFTVEQDLDWPCSWRHTNKYFNFALECRIAISRHFFLQVIKQSDFIVSIWGLRRFYY